MAPPPTVTVVVVHRDRADRCVATARAFLAQEGVDVRLTIVDNGSDPTAVARLRAGLPAADVDVIEMGANLGFGPGANVGLRRWLDSGDGDWVAVAPHDVAPEPDCLVRLVRAADPRPRAGLVSAEFGEALVPVVDPYFGGIQRPAERGDGWTRAGYPHGSLFLARRACLEAVGLFDERYFAYCEEADLAVRARRRGWDVGLVWGAVVRNTDLSTALPAVEYLKLRNSLLLVLSHYGRYRTAVRITIALADTAHRLLRPAIRPAGFSASARLRAVWDFSRGRFGPPPASLLAAARGHPEAPVQAPERAGT